MMSVTRELPIWRSLMFVPVNVEKFVATAHTRGADGYILDLEDSVQPPDKAHARTLVQSAAERVAQRGADVLVRINRPMRLAIPDLEAVISPRIKALMLPKCEGPDHVRLLSEVVGELEAERGMAVGSTLFIPMIETAPAYWQMEAIARADPRNVVLTLGAEDFALAMGMAPESDGLLVPKQQMIFAARAAGITPMGFVGTVADFKDVEVFRNIVRRSKKLGFEGASAIHPNQVKVLNEEYTPAGAEVALAEKIIAAYATAKAEGRGSIQVEGKMIDIPIVDRAERLLKRYRAIMARYGS